MFIIAYIAQSLAVHCCCYCLFCLGDKKQFAALKFVFCAFGCILYCETRQALFICNIVLTAVRQKSKQHFFIDVKTLIFSFINFQKTTLFNTATSLHSIQSSAVKAIKLDGANPCGGNFTKEKSLRDIKQVQRRNTDKMKASSFIEVMKESVGVFSGHQTCHFLQQMNSG